jgi:hypothetical protein
MGRSRKNAKAPLRAKRLRDASKETAAFWTPSPLQCYVSNCFYQGHTWRLVCVTCLFLFVQLFCCCSSSWDCCLLPTTLRASAPVPLVQQIALACVWLIHSSFLSLWVAGAHCASIYRLAQSQLVGAPTHNLYDVAGLAWPPDRPLTYYRT